MLKALVYIGLGGALGSMLRYLFYVLIKPGSFPYATLSVNVLGSLAIGFIIGWSLKNDGFSINWRLLLATGICGGFTTFSAFSLECVQFIEQQRYSAMLAYIGLSVVLGLAATFAGIQITKLV